MTPEERQLVAELFDRLASLENERRDPEAERAIREGLARAPNAVYALVQTALVQDEALKRANVRIQELEAAAGGEAPREGGSFLDNIRDAVLGREQPRGSVPSVRPGAPAAANPWGDRYTGQAMAGPTGPTPGYPGAAPGYGSPGYGGGSFLGTAAASAAGVIGGALLLNSIRSMFGPAHAASGAFDPGLSGESRTPWGGGGAGSDLAREAGIDDIAGSKTAAHGDRSPAGLFGSDHDNDQDFDADVASDFDDGDYGGSDTA